MANNFLDFLLEEVAYPESDVIFLHEHFVTLKDVTFPEVFLELGEGIKDLEHQAFLYLDYLS